MKVTKQKLGFVFVFLFLATVSFVTYHTESYPKFEDDLEAGSVQEGSIDFQRNHSFCSFRRLSPKENLILKSMAWPQTPPLRPPRTIDDSSDPAHSSFVILPRAGGGQWLVGDRLEVVVNMFDFHGRPKKYGGDVLFARLHNRALDAGVAGEVSDHLDGTYSVVFPLPWEGSAQVEVRATGVTSVAFTNRGQVLWIIDFCGGKCFQRGCSKSVAVRRPPPEAEGRERSHTKSGYYTPWAVLHLGISCEPLPVLCGPITVEDS